MEEPLPPIELPSVTRPTPDERTTALLLWAVNVVVHVLGPWLLWRLQGKGSDFVAHHAKACINHTLTVLVLILIACVVIGAATWLCLATLDDTTMTPLIAAAVLLCLLLLAVVGLAGFSLVIHVIAALKAAGGEAYVPPLCWRFVR